LVLKEVANLSIGTRKQHLGWVFSPRSEW